MASERQPAKGIQGSDSKLLLPEKHKSIERPKSFSALKVQSSAASKSRCAAKESSIVSLASEYGPSPVAPIQVDSEAGCMEDHSEYDRVSAAQDGENVSECELEQDE